MSQPCDLLELLLVDVRDLGLPAVRDMLLLAVSSALPHGGVGARSRPGDERWNPSAGTDLLDFWFVSDSGDWPFERASTFVGVEPSRTLFVSTDATTRARAEALGLISSVPDIAFMERLLP